MTLHGFPDGAICHIVENSSHLKPGAAGPLVGGIREFPTLPLVLLVLDHHATKVHVGPQKPLKPSRRMPSRINKYNPDMREFPP